MRMCALSHHIREKSNWWEKVKDDTIVEKWREELVSQREGEEEEENDDEPPLTPAMVKSCYP